LKTSIFENFYLFPVEEKYGVQKLNLEYLQTPRPDFVAMDAQVRREQRLKEIMKELKSMIAWKKT
jgi:hypothetical protein